MEAASNASVADASRAATCCSIKVRTQEGHGGLDGIRTALKIMPARTPVAMWGYSGGAYATGFAAELQKTYAPELRFAGIAVGGMLVNLRNSAQRIDDGGYATGLVIGAVIGLDWAYPEMGIYAALNEKGRAAFADSKDDCLQELLRKYSLTHLADFTAMANPLDLPRFQPYLKAVSLGHGVPSAPVYSYHAVNDELIPVADHTALMRAYCAKGVQVMHVTNPVGEHLTKEGSVAGDVLTWLADRFAGLPAPSTC